MGSRNMTPPPQKEQVQKQEQKTLPKWKQEKQKAQQTQQQETRAVNPMTMIPESASISGRAPLPPKAKQIKRLYGF